jgi:beta-barrel assembly-enhancing protease
MPSRPESRRRIEFRCAALELALLSVFALTFAGSGMAQQTAAPPATVPQAGAPLPPLAAPPPFTFTGVDLELLEKANEIDQTLNDHGAVYEDAKLSEYVTALGDDLLPPGPEPEHVVWKFHVLRDPVPNAFSLPNGSIYVNAGLLALLENEAQLASVLAHEEAHVIYRHGYLENRNYRKKALTANILGAVLLGGLAPVIAEAALNGYSRELEKEADLHAVAAINMADYSTEEMVQAFKLMETSHELELSRGFYQDHPKLEDRIGYVTEAIHATTPHTHHPLVEEERYMAAIEKVSRDDVGMDVREDRERTAVAVAERLVKQDPKSADDDRALGDAWRALGARTPDPTPEEQSSKGKKDERKMEAKLTDQEVANALAATPEGKAALEVSQKQSEQAYREALGLDPENATAHRGLGFLYEKEQRFAECAAEWRKYLELAPDAFDRAQIERRLANVEQEGAPAPVKP